MSLPPTEHMKKFLVRATVGIFGYKIVATLMTFLTSVIISRHLGIVGFGHYAYSIAWVSILSIPGVFGATDLMSREIPVIMNKGHYSQVAGLFRWTVRFSFGASSIICLFGFIILYTIRHRIDPVIYLTLSIAMGLIPMLSMIKVHEGALRGLGHIIRGQLAQVFYRPFFFLILFAGISAAVQLSAPQTMGLRIIAVLGALVLSTWFIRQNTPREIKEAEPCFASWKTWLFSGTGLTLADSASVLLERIDMILVGGLLGPAEAGLYEVAIKGAQLILFFPMAINLSIGPSVAQLYGMKNGRTLQALIFKSVVISAGGALLVFFPLLVFSQTFLSIFGPEFTAAEPVMRLLCTASFLSVLFGSSATILNMTGNEKYTLGSIVVGIIVSAVMTVLLIPRWGLVGVGWASIIAALTYNILVAYFIYSKTGIHSYFPGGYFVKQINLK